LKGFDVFILYLFARKTILDDTSVYSNRSKTSYTFQVLFPAWFLSTWDC